MTKDQLTGILVERVMRWRITPDRFLMGRRQWLSRWRFQPTENIEDAFRLLERAAPKAYAMGSNNGCEFWVRVEIDGVVGEASHVSKPTAITIAIALAMRIDPELPG